MERRKEGGGREGGRKEKGKGRTETIGCQRQGPLECRPFLPTSTSHPNSHDFAFILHSSTATLV